MITTGQWANNCRHSRFKLLKAIGKKIRKATHQRKKASVIGEISELTARPMTKFPPQRTVASNNNIYGGKFKKNTSFFFLLL